MKKIFTDFVDDIRCIELTAKGWNYVATLLLVLAGWYWLGLCDKGEFFQLTGCALYLTAAGIWSTKTAWAHKLMDWLFVDDDMVPFEDEDEDEE